MHTNEQNIILSICIPTWNRASFLNTGLEKLNTQLSEICINDIEILVSDNYSTDDTALVVQNFIHIGMPISYYCNEKNLGADGNFIKCIERAKGKFIWLLGDDDYLCDNSLAYLLRVLKDNLDAGLVHLKAHGVSKGEGNAKVFNDKKAFLQEVSYWSTFMTGNIFNAKSKELVDNPEKYIGSCFLQMPFYLSASMTSSNNIIIYRQIFDDGADSISNGGYNYFKVFVQNYLDIWKEYIDKFHIDIAVYKHIKKDIYVNFHQYFINMLLIKKTNILPEDQPRNGRKGFFIKDGKKILKKYYGNEKYALPYFFKWQIKYYLLAIKRKLYKK